MAVEPNRTGRGRKTVFRSENVPQIVLNSKKNWPWFALGGVWQTKENYIRVFILKHSGVVRGGGGRSRKGDRGLWVQTDKYSPNRTE